MAGFPEHTLISLEIHGFAQQSLIV